MKKYKLTKHTKVVEGTKLYRIQALRSFGDVSAGDLGGYIESEINLDHEGLAWVGDDAIVRDVALITGDAIAYDHAHVFENAIVSGCAMIANNARVGGSARIRGNESIFYGALVNSDKDHMEIAPVGTKNVILTFYRTNEGKINVVNYDYNLPLNSTIDEFEAIVQRKYGGTLDEIEYLAAAMCARVKMGSGKENTNV